MAGTSGRQRVAAKDLGEFRLPRPEEDWPADFGVRADKMFELIRSHTRESETLAEIRDALLVADGGKVEGSRSSEDRE